MPDDALSLPVPQSPETPPNNTPVGTTDGTGAPTNDAATALAEKIERAATGAVDQHLAESPRKGRGQRGKDKAPRKPRGSAVPPMGASTPDLFSEKHAPAPLAPVVADVEIYDEALASEVVGTLRDLMNDAASAVVRAVAKKETGDDELAKNAAAEVVMSEKVAGRFDRSGLLLAKKYGVSLKYAPEAMMLAVIVTWGKQIKGSLRVLREKGAELRQRAKQATPTDNEARLAA